MARRGATHAAQRDRLVERDEPPAMAHSEREQVQVGDLVVALHPRKVDAGVVAQGDVIGPELVVERAAGFGVRGPVASAARRRGRRKAGSSPDCLPTV